MSSKHQVHFLLLYFDMLLGFAVDGMSVHGETWSFQFSEKVDLLQHFSQMVNSATNVSLSMDSQRCPTLHIGLYGNLMMATQQAFGPRFSDEFSLLMELRSSQMEKSSVVTLLNSQHHVHLQLRLGPSSLTFISTQRREYEYA
nr:PREDICTED: uncharacterized protein LOC109639085 isoform X3 [Paralichthys olivaceus]